jgi:hypothetical protein
MILLYVGRDSTGNLNVKVSSEFDPDKSKEIIDLILTAKPPSGQRDGKALKK